MDELDSLSRELLTRFAKVNPFLGLSWLTEYENRMLGEHETPHYFVVKNADIPLLILPVLFEKISWLRFTRAKAMANYYTSIYQPVCDLEIERDEALCCEIANEMASHCIKNFKHVFEWDFGPVRESLVLEKFTEACARDHACRIDREVSFGNHYETVGEDDFDSYWARRPGRLRSTLKRKSKKLEEHPNYLKVFSNPVELESAMDDYELIYNESWKPAEAYPEVVRDLMVNMAERGQVRLGIFYIDEQPAAAQLWMKIAESWAVFKLAYRPQYEKLSIGTILTAAMIRGFFAEGHFLEIDFLSGDDSYKKDWVSGIRNQRRLRVVNMRTLGGLVAFSKRMVTS